MGAWGEGPFENDTSMDWVHELRESEDPDYPLGVLRELDGLGPLDTRAAELGIAAAEAVAASRGRVGVARGDRRPPVPAARPGAGRQPGRLSPTGFPRRLRWAWERSFRSEQLGRA
jgi:hypothetical protein